MARIRPDNSKLASQKTAKPVKVRSAEKKHEKVWNTTDHPSFGGPGEVLVVAGKAIQPGQAVRIPLGVLETIRVRLEKLEKAGYVSVGPTPSADYLEARRPARASVGAAARTHGDTPERKAARAARMAAPAEQPAEAPAEAPAPAGDAAKPAPAEEPQLATRPIRGFGRKVRTDPPPGDSGKNGG